MGGPCRWLSRELSRHHHAGAFSTSPGVATRAWSLLGPGASQRRPSRIPQRPAPCPIPIGPANQSRGRAAPNQPGSTSAANQCGSRPPQRRVLQHHATSGSVTFPGWRDGPPSRLAAPALAPTLTSGSMIRSRAPRAALPHEIEAISRTWQLVP